MLRSPEGKNQSDAVERKTTSRTRPPLIESARTPEGETLFRFREPLTYSRAKPLWETVLRLLRESRPKALILDFSESQTIDSSGIALLRLLWRHCQRHGIALQYRSVPPAAEYFLRYVESEARPVPEKPFLTLSGIVTSLGEHSLTN